MKIRYCGNCNPDVHPRRVRAALRRRFEEKDPDLVVAVNGCSRICITKGKVRDIPRGALIINAGDLKDREAAGTPGGAKFEDCSPSGRTDDPGQDSFGGVYESH